jgi:hypothetical protein
MSREIEKQKKHVQSLTTYNGINTSYSSGFGSSTLMEYNSNFTSSSIFSSDGMGYTDLRQAYVESVIPVTEDDYNKIPKYKNVEEYKAHRGNIDLTATNKSDAMRQLYNQNTERETESAALAFYYAQQSEKAKKNNTNFWSGLKQLNN